jgi:hypothetical protein
MLVFVICVFVYFVSSCVNYDYEIVGVGDNHDDSNCDRCDSNIL